MCCISTNPNYNCCLHLTSRSLLYCCNNLLIGMFKTCDLHNDPENVLVHKYYHISHNKL